MTQTHYAAADDTYWGSYDGPDPAAIVPAGAIEVPLPPPGPCHLWDGAAWQPDPTAEDARKDGDANVTLNTPINKVLRDLLWDLEQRLRAAGQDSTHADVAAAGAKNDYTAVLKDRVKAAS